MRRTLPTAASLAVMVTMFVACDGTGNGDGNGDGDVEPGAATTSTTTTSEPPRTTTTAGPEPGAIAVAVDADGLVVALDPSTGQTVRVLLDGLNVDDPAEVDVTVTPDGTTAYVTVPGQEPEAPTTIARVSTAGGDRDDVAEGFAPAVSPDGTTLTYVVTEGARPPEPVLVLRDLATGDERRLARDEQEPFHFIPDVAWTGDGAQVAFTAGEIQTGLYVVDASAASLDAARRLGPVARGEGASWGPVTPLDPDRLAVVEQCCDLPASERWLVLAVDVAEAEAEGGLLPGERTEATHVDSDPSGTRLLLVVRGGPQGGPLLRWDGGTQEPEPITDGVIAAAW